MSLTNTRKHLIALMSDPSNAVIALSGKWGTGKSHLWREVKAGSDDEKVKGALYVSLFGLTSMDQLKSKLIQCCIPETDEKSSWRRRMLQWLLGKARLLESLHQRFAALSEIALLTLPSLVTDRVVVLDDIERKHEKLSVDEVMGFIDECAQQHGTRFMLILNTDRLMDLKTWDSFREKVIDQELRLETTPSEAFDLAASQETSVYSSRIKKAVETCGISNIRIARKILKAVNRILGGRSDLSDDVLSRVIPSAVLLSAVHYKGIDDGPDFEFILNIAAAGKKSSRGQKADELDENEKKEARWRLQIQQLEIYSCDEYEHLVVEFLRSGLFDAMDLERLLARYASEGGAMRARRLSQEFHDHLIWHYKMPYADLIAKARELVEVAGLLDLYTVSSLHDLVARIPGGAAVGDEIVDAWIAAIPSGSFDAGDFNSRNFFNRPVHPRISAAIQQLQAASMSEATILDACRYLVEHNGWGQTQEAAMKSASVGDFEATIKGLETDDLKMFMFKFVDLRVHRETYLSNFGSAMDNFTQACRNIVADPGHERLGLLIKLVFKDAKIEAELESLGAGAPVAAKKD